MSPKAYSHDVSKFFNGKRMRWLPLYRRLIARLATIPALDIAARADALAIRHDGESQQTIGQIRVGTEGIEIGLRLSRAALKSRRLKPSNRRPLYITHRVTISSPGEIDDELVTWIKAANQRARNAKRRSA